MSNTKKKRFLRDICKFGIIDFIVVLLSNSVIKKSGGGSSGENK
jgi:hypothetical protein